MGFQHRFRIPILLVGFLCLLIGRVGATVDAPTTRTFRLVFDGDFLGPQLNRIADVDVNLSRRPPGTESIQPEVFSVGPRKTDCMTVLVDGWKSLLYVDSNRNFDLTDDTSGPLTVVRNGGPGYRYQQTTLSLVRNGIGIPYRVAFIESKNAPLRVVLQGHWLGRIDLPGFARPVSVTDLPDGQIGEGDVIAFEANGTTDGHNVPLRREMFLGGCLYRLSSEFQKGTTGTELLLSFTELAFSTSTLKLSGSLDRLVLDSPAEDRFALFDSAGTAPITVPAGAYSSIYSRLAGGFVSNVTEPLVAPAGEIVQLKRGSPVSNSVNFVANANTLAFDYVLRGAGGEQYAVPHSQANRERPFFVMRKAGIPICRGKFEYG